MPDENTDVFKRNMLDRYIDRPNQTIASGKYRMLDTFCFAEFMAHYYLLARIYSHKYQIPKQFQK